MLSTELTRTSAITGNVCRRLGTESTRGSTLTWFCRLCWCSSRIKLRDSPRWRYWNDWEHDWAMCRHASFCSSRSSRFLRFGALVRFARLSVSVPANLSPFPAGVGGGLTMALMRGRHFAPWPMPRADRTRPSSRIGTCCGAGCCTNFRGDWPLVMSSDSSCRL